MIAPDLYVLSTLRAAQLTQTVATLRRAATAFEQIAQLPIPADTLGEVDEYVTTLRRDLAAVEALFDQDGVLVTEERGGAA